MSQRVPLLRDALRLLASPAQSQLDHLSELGVPGGVDELGLEFDDIASAAEDMVESGELSPSQFETMVPLREKLTAMSGPKHAALWTAEALFQSPEWNGVRALARNALTAIEGS